MIKVIVKDPGKDPEVMEIQNDLKVLQELVGGYVQSVTMADDLMMLMDDDGRMKGKNANVFFTKYDDFIFGPVVFTGVNGKEFASISDKYLEGIPGVIPVWIPEIE